MCKSSVKLRYKASKMKIELKTKFNIGDIIYLIIYKSDLNKHYEPILEWQLCPEELKVYSILVKQNKTAYDIKYHFLEDEIVAIAEKNCFKSKEEAIAKCKELNELEINTPDCQKIIFPEDVFIDRAKLSKAKSLAGLADDDNGAQYPLAENDMKRGK